MKEHLRRGQTDWKVTERCGEGGGAGVERVEEGMETGGEANEHW